MVNKCRPQARFTKMRLIPLICFLLVGVLAYGNTSFSQQPSGDYSERARRMSQEAENRGLAEPFTGVTTNGDVVPGLFPIRSTGVSTAPVRKAAAAFLATLTPKQRAKTVFPVDDPEWRKWMNQHFYIRQGTGFNEMTEAQREAAFDLYAPRSALRACSSRATSCGSTTRWASSITIISKNTASGSTGSR